MNDPADKLRSLHNRTMEPQQEEPPAPRELGREAGASAADHQAVRLWLRLLSCSTQIEQSIRALLRSQFATSLPRFDYLAQLNRYPAGLRMTALSAHLMVTGANVTGLTDQLVAEGWVERVDDPSDRRALIVRMTPAGKDWFDRMAVEHQGRLRLVQKCKSEIQTEVEVRGEAHHLFLAGTSGRVVSR
jgi:DNA-binding MarR family transcriptional regulator